MALTTHVYTHLRDTTTAAAAEWLCYGVALEKCMHVLVRAVVPAGFCVFGTSFFADTHKCVYKNQTCKNVIPLSPQSSFGVT